MDKLRIYRLAMRELLSQLSNETERANNSSVIGRNRANALTHEVEQLSQLILEEERKQKR